MEMEEQNSIAVTLPPPPPPPDILPSETSKFPHWKVVFASFSICMCGLVVGTVFAFPSPAFPKMNSDPRNPFRLTLKYQSWAVSVVSFGGLTGSLLARFFIDSWGRKLTLISSMIPLTSGWLVILCAVHPWMVLVGRSFTGFTAGVCWVCTTVYVAEISPTAHRGFLLNFYDFLLCFGQVWSYLIGEFLNWTWLVVSNIAFIVFIVSSLSWIPESPRWLLLKGYSEGAEQALMWFRGKEAENVREEMELIKENIRSSDQEAVGAKEMLNRQYLQPLLLTIGLVTVQIWSGLSVIDAFTVDIFSAGGRQLAATINPYLATTILATVSLASYSFTFYLMNCAGRRVMLVISGSGMIVSILGLAAFFKVNEFHAEWAERYLSWLPLTSIISYCVAFVLGWGPIPPAMMGELWPLKIRSLAGGVTVAWAWISIFLTTQFYLPEVEAIGEFGVFLIFAGFSVAGVLFALFILPETRNKTLEEIEKSFRN